jgi:mono/diheme cytochrome c family protein
MKRFILAALAGAAISACGDEEGGSRVDDILALDGNASAGSSVYQQNCSNAACHGADGNSGPGANLSTVVPNSSDESLVDTIINGFGGMPAQNLEDREVADVLAYLIETFG